MIEINVSAGKPYFSQRNNQIRPFITCNTTSMIAALIYCGIQLPADPNFSQPEDNLTTFLLNDPRIDTFYKENSPVEYTKYIASNKDPKVSYPPNEIHSVLSYGTNLWLGKQPREITTFKVDVMTSNVLFELVKRRPVVQGGIWNGLHHITCTVGFVTSQNDIFQIEDSKDIDMTKIDHIIIDDSWGDFHSGYKTQNGNDIRIFPSEYYALVTTQNSNKKNGHFFLV